MFYSMSKRDAPPDAKSLLDQLMGGGRDQDLKEQKKNKGNNFKGDGICKHYLLGFCPAHELADTKLCRNNGVPALQCKLTHSNAAKTEFEAHPDFKKLKIEYEQNLLTILEKYVRDADGLASKETGNVKRNSAEILGSTQMKKMPEKVQLEIASLTKDMNKLMASAEEHAEDGDVEGSKFKVLLTQEIKRKLEDLKEPYERTIHVYYEEHVCDVCGQRMEAFHGSQAHRYEAHFTGLVHLLFAKIRDWHKTLKDKPEHADDKRRKRDRSREPGNDASSASNPPAEEKDDETFTKGRQVIVKGLQKNPEKNGSKGTLVEFNAEKSRWVVEFTTGNNNFKEENLELVPSAPSPPAESKTVPPDSGQEQERGGRERGGRERDRDRGGDRDRDRDRGGDRGRDRDRGGDRSRSRRR